MKKLTFIKEIVKMANHLDQKGLHKEADRLDEVILGFSKKAQSQYVKMRNDAILNGPEGYQDYAKGHAWKKDGRLYEHLGDNSIRVYVENVGTNSADLFDTLLPTAEGMDLPFNQINTSNPYLQAVRAGYSFNDTRINSILDSTLKTVFKWDEEKINKLKQYSSSPSQSSGSVAVDNLGIRLSGVKSNDGQDLFLDTQTGTLRYGVIENGPNGHTLNPGGTDYIKPTDREYINLLESSLGSSNIYTKGQKDSITKWLDWAKKTRQYSGSTPLQGTVVSDNFAGIGGSLQQQPQTQTQTSQQTTPTAPATSTDATPPPSEFNGNTSFGISPSDKTIKTYYKFKLKNGGNVFGYVIRYGNDGLYILDNLGRRKFYPINTVNLDSIKSQDEAAFLRSMGTELAERFKHEILQGRVTGPRPR